MIELNLFSFYNFSLSHFFSSSSLCLSLCHDSVWFEMNRRTEAGFEFHSLAIRRIVDFRFGQNIPKWNLWLSCGTSEWCLRSIYRKSSHDWYKTTASSYFDTCILYMYESCIRTFRKSRKWSTCEARRSWLGSTRRSESLAPDSAFDFGRWVWLRPKRENRWDINRGYRWPRPKEETEEEERKHGRKKTNSTTTSTESRPSLGWNGRVDCHSVKDWLIDWFNKRICKGTINYRRFD